jgi:hypothetical protein
MTGVMNANLSIRHIVRDIDVERGVLEAFRVAAGEDDVGSLARGRLAVSSPIPELPPITTTVCPRSRGPRRVGETVFAVVMASSDGRCRRRPLT